MEQRFSSGSGRSSFSIYLPTISVSRLTSSPRIGHCRLVWLTVWGIVAQRSSPVDRRHSQADPVYRDRAFFPPHSVKWQELRGWCTIPPYHPAGCGRYARHRLHGPPRYVRQTARLQAWARSRLTELPTVSCVRAERSSVSCMTSAEKPSGRICVTRQTDAVYCDAVTDLCMLQNRPRLERQHGGVLSAFDLPYPSDFFNDPGEHGYSTSLSIKILAQLEKLEAVLQMK